MPIYHALDHFIPHSMQCQVKHESHLVIVLILYGNALDVLIFKVLIG